MEKLIEQRYKEFDEMYEENELPPYNAAFNYFRAGYKAAFDDDVLTVLSQILWINYLEKPNELSPFWMVVGEPNEWNRGEFYPKGYLMHDPRFLSFSIPETKQLTWKELALRLDIHTSDIVEDGHNCNLCPFSDECKAFFKYKNPDEQPQCSFWQDKVDKKVYEANLDRNKIMADLFQRRDIHVL